MASGKFFGAVGFGTQVNNVPGVWEEVIVERNLYGDLQNNYALIRATDKVNSDQTVNNQLSLVADAFAYEHYDAIRYVIWMGVAWTVSSIRLTPGNPRLILTIGEVYDGPKAGSTGGA